LENRINYKLEQLGSAVMDFSHSLSIDLSPLAEDIVDVIRNGQVQKFEFTIELLWKVIKIYLDEAHGFDEKSPKAAVKRFYLLECIENEEYALLMNGLNDRNKLSHIYNKKQFEDIYRNMFEYSKLFIIVLEKLRTGLRDSASQSGR